MKRVFALLVVLFPLVPIVNAESTMTPADEIRRVLENLGKMVDISTAVEGYAIAHHSLPKAKTPAELSYAITGHDALVAYLVDPWGTPYTIDSDPARGSYTIVSAGSNRTFERSTWATKADTREATADVVIRDGAFIRSPREWALAEFHKLRPDAVKVLGSSLEQTRARGTLMNVMALRVALAGYAADHDGAYPRGTEDDVFNTLAKTSAYLKRSDDWGTPLRIDVQQTRYRIVSAGSDKRFDEPGKEPPLTAFAQDLVCDDAQCPDEWVASKDPLGQSYTTLLIFDAKYEQQKSLSPEERAAMRRQALEKEFDSRAAHYFCVEAIAAYDALQKEFPGYEDMQRLGVLVDKFTHPLPAIPDGMPADLRQKMLALHKEDHYMTDAEAASTARWLRSTLGAYASKYPDQFGPVSQLASVVEHTDGAAAALAVLKRYGAAHPKDLDFRKTRLRMYLNAGQRSEAMAEAEAIANMSPTDAEQWYVAGVTAYDATNAPAAAATSTAGPAPESAAKDRAIIDKGIGWLERAIALKPDYFEAMTYESLLYRAAALREKSPAKQKALTDKADALRDRAKEIVAKKRQKAPS